MNSIIHSHGETFRAYSCTVCKALDTDPEALAKHEAMHEQEPLIIKSIWARTPGPRPKGQIYHKSDKPRKKRGEIHA